MPITHNKNLPFAGRQVEYHMLTEAHFKRHVFFNFRIEVILTVNPDLEKPKLCC